MPPVLAKVEGRQLGALRKEAPLAAEDAAIDRRLPEARPRGPRADEVSAACLRIVRVKLALRDLGDGESLVGGRLEENPAE